LDLEEDEEDAEEELPEPEGTGWRTERRAPSVLTVGGAEIFRGSYLDRFPEGLLAAAEVEGLFLFSWEDMVSELR
jgi:hypothetical protein